MANPGQGGGGGNKPHAPKLLCLTLSLSEPTKVPGGWEVEATAQVSRGGKAPVQGEGVEFMLGAQTLGGPRFTNAQGRAVKTGIAVPAPGRYKVSAQIVGTMVQDEAHFTVAAEKPPEKPKPGCDPTVTVTGGNKQYTLHVTVLSAEGKPVPEWPVILNDSVFGAQPAKTTNDEGMTTFDLDFANAQDMSIVVVTVLGTTYKWARRFNQPQP